MNSTIRIVHPKKFSTLKSVASWNAGGPACMAPSATRIGQYSWKYASRTVDSTQTFVAIPTKNKYQIPSRYCERRFRRGLSLGWYRHWRRSPRTS